MVGQGKRQLGSISQRKGTPLLSLTTHDFVSPYQLNYSYASRRQKKMFIYAWYNNLSWIQHQAMQNCSGIGCIENYQNQFHGPGQVAKWFFFSLFSCKYPSSSCSFFVGSKHGYSRRQITESLWAEIPIGSNAIPGRASLVRGPFFNKRLWLGFR